MVTTSSFTSIPWEDQFSLQKIPPQAPFLSALALDLGKSTQFAPAIFPSHQLCMVQKFFHENPLPTREPLILFGKILERSLWAHCPDAPPMQRININCTEKRLNGYYGANRVRISWSGSDGLYVILILLPLEGPDIPAVAPPATLSLVPFRPEERLVPTRLLLPFPSVERRPSPPPRPSSRPSSPPPSRPSSPPPSRPSSPPPPPPYTHRMRRESAPSSPAKREGGKTRPRGNSFRFSIQNGDHIEGSKILIQHLHLAPGASMFTQK